MLQHGTLVVSMEERICVLLREDQQPLKHDKMRCPVSQKTKKKRQQRAQSRLALARLRQQQREQRQQTAAQRAQRQWNKTLRHLADLGAMVKQHADSRDGKQKTIYEVTFEEKTHQFGTRFRVQRWLKRERERQAEQQMSWAKRHIAWMIANTCDDHGNPWPD